ncbi:nucleotide sugar dehydrogenase [Desulfofarcimen acetoxidans DSM 771]|uniref:Nucleotide sugar dehydrogenase n=1 Tax=Desulfofarcimen acetoxidans (strain ATCC 49208 / DSM 771 / KCTC 5769 / VKM B-1644 / 5575) TaxID=485916 RepID=C8W2E4_DESAS|nr:nucleotide sugar dehydrogenase [Desulfofarcimen acetoxidans]ACV63628.1 nucleotide sugar dehydrogenase [Desulfofarcimen acetoxidans DSM 771]
MSENEQRPYISEKLVEKLLNKKARIAIIGLGYVGLPLAVEQAKIGFEVIGVEIDSSRVNMLKEGKSYIQDVTDAALGELVNSGRFKVIDDYSLLAQVVDVVVICVPTPLNEMRQPDLSYINSAVSKIARNLRRGQLISLESTTFPGTINEIVLPMLEDSGLKVGLDYFLAFSPERVDPGNKKYTTVNVAKVVGGVTPICTDIAVTFYRQSLANVVPVSSPDAAEMTKIFENTYRAVNIALVNEFMLLCDRMGLDIWEILDAAATKPFGIQVFYPGPGVGGHCIPVDPFYLAWKARAYGFQPRFVELTGELNNQVLEYVIQKIITVLNDHGKCLNGSKILILGVAYKKDINDVRESPALKIIKQLQDKKAVVQYYDPYIPQICLSDKGDYLHCIEFTGEKIAGYDLVVIVTDHSCIDYQQIAEAARLIIDTRNAAKKVIRGREKIIKI